MSKATVTLISHTRCRVEGLDTHTTRLLDDALAMDVPGSKFSPQVRSGLWDGRRHLFSEKTGLFPAGLLSKVEAFLAEAGVSYKVVDLRGDLLPEAKLERLTPDLLKGITLRDYQMNAVRKALTAQHGILWLATNAGKTECAAAIMRVLKARRCLFLVHKKTLLAQTRERIALRLGTIEEHIGIIGEGRFEPRHITIATIQSLTRKSTKEKMKVIKQYLGTIELLFIDEGHHAKAITWYKLVQKIQAQYRYILSGTPFGSGNGLMVEATVGPVIDRVSNETLISLGVSAVPTIEMLEVDEPEIAAGRSWDEVYKEGIVANTMRNTLIAKRARRFAEKDMPTLILVRELWHGDMLCTLLQEYGVSHAFVHGKMPTSMVATEKVRFEAGKTKVLIASPIFDEGVDVPAIKALIVADGGKSVRAVLQKIGRGLRHKEGDNTLSVVDFADYTHRWLAQHSQERLTIYTDEGFRVQT